MKSYAHFKVFNVICQLPTRKVKPIYIPDENV